MVRRAKRGKRSGAGQQQVLLLEKRERNRARGWGGKRAGAGRKPKGPRPLGDRSAVPHHRRPQVRRSEPVHITLRMMPHVWNLRSQRAFRVVGRALEGLHEIGVRPTHYSVQGNHVHLLLEVEGQAHLTRAMRSFGNRLAKGMNRLMRRTGRVIADRYHLVVLRNPRQVAHAIRYVLSNSRKHTLEQGKTITGPLADAYAAGPMDHVPPTMRLRPSTFVLEPRTWLLRVGWALRQGRIRSY